MRSWAGMQVPFSGARMGSNTEEHWGYKKAQLLFNSVFWPTHCFSWFWMNGCSGLFPWSLAHQFYSILRHFQRAQLRPFPLTSSLGTVLRLCTAVTCLIWCSHPTFGDLCAASFCGTGISPVCRRKSLLFDLHFPRPRMIPKRKLKPMFLLS